MLAKRSCCILWLWKLLAWPPICSKSTVSRDFLPSIVLVLVDHQEVYDELSTGHGHVGRVELLPARWRHARARVLCRLALRARAVLVGVSVSGVQAVGA